MQLLEKVASATIQLRKTTGLSCDELVQLVDIAVNGSGASGQAPKLNERGIPVCCFCGRPYPVERTKATGVIWPHLCCPCASTASQAHPICGSTGSGRNHLAQNVPGRDDHRGGHGTRICHG